MKNNWLTSFAEKNLWGLLGLLVMGGVFATRVQALETKFDSMQNQMQGIIENQKAIIQLQTQQLNIEDDVSEMKSDIKTLLGRTNNN